MAAKAKPATQTIAGLREKLKASEAARQSLLDEATDQARHSSEKTYQLQQELRQRDKQIEALTHEINQMRDMVHSAELELARRAGYMQAIDDAKPPRLIEEPRPAESDRARRYRMRGDGVIDGHPWWRR